jgi:hypothetical protein
MHSWKGKYLSAYLFRANLVTVTIKALLQNNDAGLFSFNFRRGWRDSTPRPLVKEPRFLSMSGDTVVRKWGPPASFLVPGLATCTLLESVLKQTP